MRTRRHLLAHLTIFICLVVASAAAMANDWDVNAPPGETRTVSLDVRTGTWMSVDVSPDGRQVVFDLLGDVYLLPIAGGTARSLTSGLAWNKQPRFSPDGRRIAFTSDRAGGDNVWVIDADGGNPRQVTREDFRLPTNPAWHPDGRFIAARKHFTTTRSLGTGEIWAWSVDGGEGVRLVERPTPEFQKELGEPAFSPDGRYLYFTQNVTPGPIFQYAQNSNAEIFQVRRQDLTTGEIEPVVTGPGGAVRPTPSPDGRSLAFVRRVRTNGSLNTGLFLKDLRSGEEHLLYDGLDRDMQETWSVHGVYPGMAWTPDSASIIFWAGGGLNRIDVASGAVADIPFHVQDERQVVVPPRFEVDVAPDEVEARMVRFASVSPDGGRVVFEAFGRLWVRELPDGQPRRVTRDNEAAFELYPAWSRDGRRLAFVRWTDVGLGHIYTIDRAGGRSQRVTADPGHYRRPQFSPDGTMLVFERASGGNLVAPHWSVDPGIYRMPVAGGPMLRISDDGSHPHFAAGDRIYLNRVADAEDGRERQLVSVDVNGVDPRVHARAKHAAHLRISPNGQWLAFRENFHVFAVPVPPGGELTLSRETKAVPQRQATDVGGEFLSWSTGDVLTWTVGPQLHAINLTQVPPVAAVTPADGDDDDAQRRDPQTADDDEDAQQPDTVVTELTVRQPADRPRGTLALIGARIVTADDDDRVIEQGVVLVRDNRIDAVGALGELTVPEGATVVDVAGRTILPGLIDVHAHGAQGVDDLIPQQNWRALAHLAFGVTTVHDPSNRASEIFAAAEYQRAGVILAPRLFSTGEILYGAHSPSYVHIGSLDDARAHVGRLKAQGAIAVKNYNQPRREQRQMVVAAAREAGLMVVAEGGSLYHMDMNLIADGNTGIEHNVPGQRFYDDVLQFWPQTGVGYTPTLVVTYGGIWGEDWFYQHHEIWRHPLLSRFVPPTVLQPRAVRRQMAPDSDYQAWVDAAAAAKRLMERGVLVNIGAHGQREGLGAHWELRGFVRGGMTPLQALRTATINPARYLGLDRDLGSIEPGKLADLVIVDGDPLTDIEDAENIVYVMLNGRLFEGGTLRETVTGDRTLRPFYWQGEAEAGPQ